MRDQVLAFRITLCRTMSCPILSYSILSSPLLSCHVVSCCIYVSTRQHNSNPTPNAQEHESTVSLDTHSHLPASTHSQNRRRNATSCLACHDTRREETIASLGISDKFLYFRSCLLYPSYPSSLPLLTCLFYRELDMGIIAYVTFIRETSLLGGRS